LWVGRGRADRVRLPVESEDLRVEEILEIQRGQGLRLKSIVRGNSKG
jgi:hypothetical protein